MDWWKENFVNRRDYILDHLSELTMNSDETLLIMLIDFLNQHQIPITHGVLAKRMKKDSEEIDDLLSQLSAKGYLQLTFQNGKILFEIDGVFAGANEKAMRFDASLFDLFETEFGRPLSQMELQRLADWLNEYNQKLIGYALREALTYEHLSFDYIERILIEWKKRGLRPEEYEEGKR